MPNEALERAREIERKRLKEEAQGSAKWSVGGSTVALCSFALYVVSSDYFARLATIWGAFIGTGLALLFTISTLRALSALKSVDEGEEPIFACSRCGAPMYTPPCNQCPTP
jgi:hypothetical protein